MLPQDYKVQSYSVYKYMFFNDILRMTKFGSLKKILA